MSAAKTHDALDEALVRRLLAAQFPRWAELPVRSAGAHGTVNAVFRIGDDLAVRLPRRASGATDVAREGELLPRLAERLPLPIPVPLALGEPGEGYPWRWSVFRWIEGAHAVPGTLADTAPLAADLAAFVTALHAVDTAGAPRGYRGQPLAERDEATRTAIAELRGIIDTDAATAAWEEALRAPAWDGPGVWLHGDLQPGNLIVADGRLRAVIDWGCTGYGEPAADLLPAWNLLTPSTRPAFRAAVGADAATWARGRGWALSIALIELPYYRTRSEWMAMNARHVIGQVLDDLAGR